MEAGMRTSELEAWAYQIIERVRRHQPIEDDRVELKATMIEATKAARLIAGHANQSHGEPILWLMGVDEKQGITGVPHVEMSNWLKPYKSCFSENVYPDLLKHAVLPVESMSVVMLYFETERAPYVVKDKSGGHLLEVPWRQGTNCYSATRSQLLQLLAPTIKAPAIEYMKSYAQGYFQHDETGWYVTAFFYISPRSVPTYIPLHKCHIEIEIDDAVATTPLGQLTVTQPYPHKVYGTQIPLNEPGLFNFTAFGKSSPLMHHAVYDKPLAVTLSLRTVDADNVSRVQFVIPFQKTEDNLYHWKDRVDWKGKTSFQADHEKRTTGRVTPL